MPNQAPETLTSSMSTKERILELVKQMPETATYEQAVERILVLQELEASLQEAARGEVIALEEVERQMDAWRV